MRVRILGCYGGSASGLRTTCFLVDDRVAFDAGALTTALTVEEQIAIEALFLTHSHFDHLVGLPFLADNIFPHRNEPLPVYGHEDTIRCVRDHLFNGRIWPDFSTLSNGRTTVIALEPIAAGKKIRIAGLDISPVPMDHIVPCFGYIVQASDAALAICGDTCSTRTLAGAASGIRNLKAVFLEASFPESESGTARRSRHLSTATFAAEARRLPPDVAIFAYHAKPEFREAIRDEIAALGLGNVALLEQDEVYTF